MDKEESEMTKETKKMRRDVDGKVMRRDYGKGTRSEVMKLTLACGCLPYHRLALLGMNVKTVQKKIREMQEEGVLEVYHKKDVWVVGIKDFAKKSSEYSENIGSKLMRYYETFGFTDYKRARFAKEWESLRVIRNAESYMFMYGAGIECVLGQKVSLRAKEGKIQNSYYTARELKAYNNYHADIDSEKLLQATRVNGLTISDGGTYPIYNVGKSIITYTRSGEKKIEVYINKAMAMKDLPPIKGSIVLASNNMLFADMVVPKTQKITEQLSYMEGVYDHVYGLPLTEDGQKMMRLLGKPGWDTQIFTDLLGSDCKNNQSGTIECDGYKDGVYYFCYCVPDIKRLKLFMRRAEIENNKSKFCILCFDTQKELISRIAENIARVKATSFDTYYSYFMQKKGETHGK